MGSLEYDEFPASCAEEYEETLDMIEDLTEEELRELNDTFDPENSLLPIHERVNYQCEKAPSRIFNKDQLAEHLKSKLNFGALRPVTHPHSMADKIKAAESKIGNDYVPFVKPEKDYGNHTLELPRLKSVPRARSPSPLPDLTEEEIKCIENATEDELVEVAAQLKMNELVTAEQIESIRRGDKPVGTGILRPTLVRTQYPQKSFSIDEDDDEEEYIDVDGMVKAMRSKGEDISIIVCNNQPYMDPEVLEEIAAHLLANKNIRHLSLANCNFTDSVVDSFAEALMNNTKLETLNLESNFITSPGIKKLLDAIQDNKTLREIRLENQYSKIGPKCEAEMAACVEKNFVLLSFGYSFGTRGPRDSMNRYILRNNDLLRAARRNGESFYNLAEQKRIIAKFRPPWVLRRPKRKGQDSFEGRKIVMRGDSKKKKKKGPAMMNEMLAKAAQVSKRWEDKEKTGELNSEFQRIEEQSKKKLENGVQNSEEVKEEGDTDRRRRRRNRDAAGEEEEEEGVVENGEVERKRRGKDPSSALDSAEGMGAARRRGRRGGDDEDDDEQGSGKGDEQEDEADGKRGRGKMDAETRRRQMRGGKIVEDEKESLGPAMRRRKKVDHDDEEEMDFSQFEQKPEEDSNENEAEKKSNNEDANKSRIPSGRKIAGQPVASLDSASMRGRRRNRAADDEGEDLDAMLSSVDGGSESKGRKRESEPSEEEAGQDAVLRRRRRGDNEGESLDDLLGSVPRMEVDDDEAGYDDDDERIGMLDENGVRVPTGKAIGAQPVARMETASLRGRRRRNVDDDEGESLDDLLKSVDKKDEPVKETKKPEEDTSSEKSQPSSRRESATKLPTGRQVSRQQVEELSALSFKNRRRNRAYEDEEEDIDSLLSSVQKKDQNGDDDDEYEDGNALEETGKRARLPRGERLAEQQAKSLEPLTMKGRRRKGYADDEQMEEDSDLGEGEDGEVGRRVGGRGGESGDGRVRQRGSGVGQGNESFGNASMKGRKRRDVIDDDDTMKDDTGNDEEADDDEGGMAVQEGGDTRKERGARIPKGKQLAVQQTAQLGAVSLKDRRRRVIHDEEEDLDSMLADTVTEKDGTDQISVDSKNNTNASDNRGPRIPKGHKIATQEQTSLEAVSLKGRRRRVIEDEEEDVDKMLSSVSEKKTNDETISKEDKTESFAERRRRRRGDAEEEAQEEEKMTNGYQEDIAGDRARRRQKPKDDDNDDDAEKKREMRRRQREAANEEKVANGPAKEEKPAPVEVKKAPEPKKEASVAPIPERPAVDLSKPMSLRERRRLKEQGLL